MTMHDHNDNHGNGTCQLPGLITDIKTQQRRSDRINIYIDGEFCFACRAEVAVRFGLQSGSELTTAIRDLALQEDAFLSSYASAIELLAYRARSEREIRDRLRRRGYEADAIDRTVVRLQENRYLDDADFARFWIENRTANRPRGDRALRQELRLKGVNASIIDHALDDAGLDQQGMAIEAAQKRMASLSGLTPEIQRRRLTGFLQRRGFGWESIKPALEEALGTGNEAENEEFEEP